MMLMMIMIVVVTAVTHQAWLGLGLGAEPEDDTAVSKLVVSISKFFLHFTCIFTLPRHFTCKGKR